MPMAPHLHPLPARGCWVTSWGVVHNEWKIRGELAKRLHCSSSRWICSEVKELLLLPAKRAQMFFSFHRPARGAQVSAIEPHVCDGGEPLLCKVPGTKITRHGTGGRRAEVI